MASYLPGYWLRLELPCAAWGPLWLLALGISGAWIGRLHKRQRRFAWFQFAFINLSRSGTAYFGNSFRSFFSRLTSVLNCFGSCFAKAP
jgi:hypothetical protein